MQYIAVDEKQTRPPNLLLWFSTKSVLYEQDHFRRFRFLYLEHRISYGEFMSKNRCYLFGRAACSSEVY